MVASTALRPKLAIILIVVGFLFVIVTFLAAFTIYAYIAGVLGLACVVSGLILRDRSRVKEGQCVVPPVGHDRQRTTPRRRGLSRGHWRFRVVILVVALVAGSTIGWAVSSSRSGRLPLIAVQPPVATTLSWFEAVNVHNMPLALAHFVPGDQEMMRWSSWGPPFTHLRCSLSSDATTQAEVYCTFADINDPDMGMSNVSFWDVYLVRTSSGRWLIDNYGQG